MQGNHVHHAHAKHSRLRPTRAAARYGKSWPVRARKLQGAALAARSWLGLAVGLHALVVGLGCGGGGELGAACETHDDCNATLQCAAQVCVERCARAPQCGDGFSCSRDGLCVAASGVQGETCYAESFCGKGLACMLGTADRDADGIVLATCAPDQQGHAVGDTCRGDSDCRNGTCALGHCVDVCAEDIDCPLAMTCTSIPRVTSERATYPTFQGCLPSNGSVAFDVTGTGPNQRLAVPVPGNARSLTLSMTVDDSTHRVGLARLVSPRNRLLYSLPATVEDYYANLVRHLPAREISVAQLPSNPAMGFEHGVYLADVATFRTIGTPGAATPRVMAALRLGSNATLDITFAIVDLAQHHCAPAFAGVTLRADTAKDVTPLQAEYLPAIRSLLARAGITLGNVRFRDIADHAELAALAVADTEQLLRLSETASGITVFLVRSISPAGVFAIGPKPGPAGLIGTSRSGVVISMEALCYRSWTTLARTTTRQIFSYLGLYDNIDPTGGLDPIADTDESMENIMHFSELGGTVITEGQGEIVRRSPVLR